MAPQNEITQSHGVTDQDWHKRWHEHEKEQARLGSSHVVPIVPSGVWVGTVPCSHQSQPKKGPSPSPRSTMGWDNPIPTGNPTWDCSTASLTPMVTSWHNE